MTQGTHDIRGTAEDGGFMDNIAGTIDLEKRVKECQALEMFKRASRKDDNCFSSLVGLPEPVHSVGW